MDVSKEEQIGVHKGALSVLAKEREEFVKLIGIVEQLMQAHMNALKDLGVDLKAEFEKAQGAMKKEGSKNKAGRNLSGRL